VTTVPEPFTSRKVGEDLIEVFIGPQHPGSGHMRIVLKLDGDFIVEADPDIGYVHRTMEKLAEGREWIKNMMLFERMAILDSCNVTLAYMKALEKLLGITPPPRARYLRTILCEINRIASHLYGLGIFSIMLGHSTMYMWFYGDREVFVELAEMLTGQRLTHSYHLPGGVRRDMPKSFPEEVEKALKYIEKRIPEYEKMFINNPVVRSRIENVGVLSREKAVSLGVVGPNLRASGVKHDIRIEEPYAAYDEIDFEVPVYNEGDALARTMQRIDEIRSSIEIIRQAVKNIPEGPLIYEGYQKYFTKIMKEVFEKQGRVKFPTALLNLKPPEGRSYARVEGGRGEYYFYIVSNGTPKPYRIRIVSPSFRNVLLFKYLLPGHRLADLPAIYGSIDYFPPGADR
jgi:NADH-quinone oxidoreductase subunit D